MRTCEKVTHYATFPLMELRCLGNESEVESVSIREMSRPAEKFTNDQNEVKLAVPPACLCADTHRLGESIASGAVARTVAAHAWMYPEPFLHKQDRRYYQLKEITLDS